jgi:hypothetical protein
MHCRARLRHVVSHDFAVPRHTADGDVIDNPDAWVTDRKTIKDL